MDHGRQLARAHTDKHQVADGLARARHQQRDHARQLRVARVAWPWLAAPQHHQCLLRRDAEFAQRRLRPPVV
jgi:hypothetical protein